MLSFNIRPVGDDDENWVREFIIKHWGSERVISRGIIHYPYKLPGFIAIRNKKRVGLITYNFRKDECEIVTLNSVKENIGIGTALVKLVEKEALHNKCKRIWLITTNDNLSALSFYQKRGFRLVAVYRDAIKKSRELKPEIPLIGIDGIPLRDEIELEKIV